MNSEMTGLNQFFWITLELTAAVIESGVKVVWKIVGKRVFFQKMQGKLTALSQVRSQPLMMAKSCKQLATHHPNAGILLISHQSWIVYLCPVGHQKGTKCTA